LSLPPADESFVTAGNRACVPWEDTDMAWTTPKISEVACGMEINMYVSAKKK
jgi:coenzyme PQQ precursor peptide PqqA